MTQRMISLCRKEVVAWASCPCVAKGFSHGQDAHAPGFGPNEALRALFPTEQE